MRPVAIATQLERGEGETRGKNSFLILFRRIIALVYYIGIYNNSLHGMAHSFIESCKPLCHDKAVIHVIILVSFLWLWFLF